MVIPWQIQNPLQKKSSVLMKNQSGFILVCTVILLPLVMSVFLFSVILLNFKLTRDKAQHRCHTAILELQAKQSDELEKLLKLNKSAYYLRIQRKVADQSVKVAKKSHPALLAAALAYQQKIQLMQKKLRLKQKWIIQAAHSVYQKDIELIKFKMAKENTPVQSSSGSQKFLLKVRGKDSQSPTYHTTLKTSQHHKFSILYKWNASEEITKIMKRFKLPVNFSSRCRATIHKRGSRWRSELR